MEGIVGMLYHYATDGQHKPVDLKDHYGGSACWLVAAAPQLADLPLARIQASRLPVVVINNATGSNGPDGYDFVRPDIWIATDGPWRFLQAIWRDATALKIVPNRWWWEPVPHSLDKTCDMPNVLFYEQNIDDFRYDNFLADLGSFPWWHDTLLSAVAILYWLGFRTLYCAGVSLTVDSPGKVYAFDAWNEVDRTKRDKRAGTNMMHYASVWNRLRLLRTTFRLGGLSIVSATPSSGLNDIFPYRDAGEVCAEVEATFVHESTKGLYDHDAPRGLPETLVEIKDYKPPNMPATDESRIKEQAGMQARNMNRIADLEAKRSGYMERFAYLQAAQEEMRAAAQRKETGNG